MIHSLNPLSSIHSFIHPHLSLSLRDSFIRELRARHHTRGRHERHVLEAAHSLRVRLQELRLTPLLLSPTGSTASKYFFFCTCAGVAGSPSNPAKVTRSPILAPSGGSISAPCSWSSVDAHSSMPFEGNPPSFRGFRLHRTHTR